MFRYMIKPTKMTLYFLVVEQLELKFIYRHTLIKEKNKMGSSSISFGFNILRN